MMHRWFAILSVAALLAGCGSGHAPATRELNEEGDPGGPQSGMPEGAGHGMPGAPVADMATLGLDPPEIWVEEEPHSRSTIGEFSLPRAEGDEEDARLTVVVMGGPVDAYAGMWRSEFGGKLERDSQKEYAIPGARVAAFDFSGTYLAAHGTSEAAEGQPGYRMLAAVVTPQEAPQYLVKCYGPEKTVAKHYDAFWDFLNVTPGDEAASASHTHPSAEPEGAEPRGGSVPLAVLRLEAPDDWIRKPPRSGFVLVEFSLPRAEGDDADARLTVSSAAGSVEQNVARWRKQFGDAPAKQSQEEIEVADIPVTVVDLSGVYQERMGMVGPVTEHPGYRMLGALFNLGDQHQVIKCYGPEKTVAKYAGQFRDFLQSAEAQSLQSPPPMHGAGPSAVTEPKPSTTAPTEEGTMEAIQEKPGTTEATKEEPAPPEGTEEKPAPPEATAAQPEPSESGETTETAEGSKSEPAQSKADETEEDADTSKGEPASEQTESSGPSGS